MSSYSLFTIRVTQDAPVTRDQLAAALRVRGVETGVYYPRVVFDEPAFRGHPRVRADAVPTARALTSQVLSLPVHPGLSRSDLSHVVDAVRAAMA